VYWSSVVVYLAALTITRVILHCNWSSFHLNLVLVSHIAPHTYLVCSSPSAHSYIMNSVYSILYHSAWAFERYRHSVQIPCTLSGAFEARVYQYTLGYIGAPWQLWCPFQNCEHIIDN